MKDEGGAGFAGSSPPFLGRERAAVSVNESSAAVSKPRGVWLRMRMVKKSRRTPQLKTVLMMMLE